MKTWQTGLAAICLLAASPAAQAEWGDAIYRDGAFDVEYIWHAGLLYGYSCAVDDGLVIHASGSYIHAVRYDDLNGFKGSHTFMGFRTKKVNGQIPSYATRAVIVDTAIDQIGANYWGPQGWKIPNTTIFGMTIWGNLRCDGVVEYCYEQAGLNPGIDALQFQGGPQWQHMQLDDAGVIAPSVSFTAPLSSYTNPALPYLTHEPSILLSATAQDTHSGLAYGPAYFYSFATFTNSAWVTTIIGKGSATNSFTFPRVNELYRFSVKAYDNGGASASARDIFVKQEPYSGWIHTVIEPYEARAAGAQFRVDGGAWQTSGQTLYVFEGAHVIEFKAVQNWIAPPPQSVQVTRNATAECTGRYAQSAGAIQVFLEPPAAVAEGARWWSGWGSHYTNGAIRAGLPAGSQAFVTFEPTAHWTPPDMRSVTVPDGGITQITGTYQMATAVLQVDLFPPAVTNTARWRYVQEGVTSAWQVASQTCTIRANIETALQFSDVPNWTTPGTAVLTVQTGYFRRTSGMYTQHGALQVWIEPREAVQDGALWGTVVPGGDGEFMWFASGTVVTGLTTGVRGLYYINPEWQPWMMTNTWWEAPDMTDPVTITGNELLVVTGRYACTRGAVSVRLSPDDAVSGGAMWRLAQDGPIQWHTSGEVVYGVEPREYDVFFKPTSGFNTPTVLMINVQADTAVVTNAIYTKHFYSDLYAGKEGSHIFPYATWASAATNIQDAIDAGMDGSTVWVDDGEYRVLTPLLLGKGVALRSAGGSAAAILDGGGTNNCLLLSHADALAEGFIVRNGRATYGGGIYMSAGTVSNCVITSCTALSYGGGVFMHAGCRLLDSILSNNTALTNDAGGVYLNMGGVVDRCTVVSNLARKAGGAFLYAGGTVRNSLFAYNRAGHDYYLPENGTGGGVLCYLPGPVVENCTIVFNSAIFGGGLYRNSGGAARNCIVYDNTAPSGANHYGGVAELTERFCTTPSLGSGCITAPPQWTDAPHGDFRLLPTSPCLNAGTNLAWMSGAGDVERYPRISSTTVDIGAYERSPTHYVWTSGAHRWPFLSWTDAATNLQACADAAGVMDEVLVRPGTYRNNGDVIISRPLTLTGVGGAASTFIDGQGSHRCLVTAADTQLSGFTLSGGSAAIGAGLYCSTTGTVLRSCVFSGNTAAQYGGGVFFAANGGQVDRCVFHGNAAVSKQGGGIYARTGCTIRNTLITANTANEGGGVFLYQGGVIDSCTISSNSAPTTGGLRFYSGGGIVRNSIIYFNGSDIGSFGGSGTVTWSCTPATAGTGNITLAPLFSAAGNYHLDPLSPCIDAGHTLAWMNAAGDLENYPRVTGASVDMGAFERSPVHYVTPEGESIWPYRSWSESARDPQAAINAAELGDTVIISNGTYVLKAGILIDKPVLVKSCAGAAETILDGGDTLRVAEILCGTLEGFRLVNGLADDNGGGASIEGGGILRGCIVDHCSSKGSAGGVALYGEGIVEHCLLENNYSQQDGGGITLKGEGSLLRCSEVVGNRSDTAGGGAVAALGARIENCLITGNMAHGIGGGVYLAEGELDSCTVFGNETEDAGPGVANMWGIVSRSIIVGNGSGPQYVDESGQWEDTCTYPVIGEGGIEDDPLFADAPYDLRLMTGSPCIDRSRTGPAEDFSGQVRPLDGDNDNELRFDMGAYEFLHPLADSDGDGMGDAWENTHFGSATNGNAAADSDGDGTPDLDEYRADTHPWNTNSFLRFTGLRVTDAEVKYPVTINWQGGVMAWQYIEGTTNLNGAATAWAPLFTNPPPTQVTNSISIPKSGSRKFYRIRAQR